MLIQPAVHNYVIHIITYYLKGQECSKANVKHLCLPCNQVPIHVRADSFPSHLDPRSEGFLGCPDSSFCVWWLWGVQGRNIHFDLQPGANKSTCEFSLTSSKSLQNFGTLPLRSSFALCLTVVSVLKRELSSPWDFSMA